MKVRQLIKQLEALDPELEVYAICGSSGCSYEVGSAYDREKWETDDIGRLSELLNGTKVIILSLD